MEIAAEVTSGTNGPRAKGAGGLALVRGIWQGAGMRESEIGRAGRIGLIVAPGLLAFVLLMEPPAGLSVAVWRTVGVVGVMVILWMTEAIPIPVTALLPLVLFPLLEVAPFKDAAAPFANPVIYLFLGGFVLALGLQL